MGYAVAKFEINEAASAQFPIVRHTAEVGWLPLPPDVALQKRGGEAGMLFRNELMTKLKEFNSWIDDGLRAGLEGTRYKKTLQLAAQARNTSLFFFCLSGKLPVIMYALFTWINSHELVPAHPDRM